MDNLFVTWNLEDWLTDVGASLVERRFANASSLTTMESAVYEVWLLDTEARNGGVSQYFCNHGLQQWVACQAAALAVGLTTFRAFADALNAIIGATQDPYEVIRANGDPAEDLWYFYQPAVVQELSVLYQNAL